MIIRALTTDLDDTLWELHPVMKRAEQKVLDFARREIPQAVGPLSDGELLMEVRVQLLAEQPQLRYDLSRWRLTLYCLVLERAGQSAKEARRNADRLFEVYRHWRNQVELFAGVGEALRELAGSFKLGSLTNGNADLEQIGIAELFDFSLNATQVGSEKPEARMFMAAVAKAGCPPEQVMHLGDSPEMDVDGARQAGLQALWFNPSGAEWSGEGPVPMQLRDWRDLPDLLRPYAAEPG